ncbi:cache domain-containing sensor histidine kinase [Paenibacillus eucommiae]|uniref:histidine kinase n=1 Tax=Paenibacillus eucommiae TaxID=1355755 RepID=A0ABS4J0T2_9BACL|nr:histidine kinase [Paenibacillus eucommiae]MBP1993447.1 two-component system sensor histidine kinase YesM [Paenibacillus eucommiae]
MIRNSIRNKLIIFLLIATLIPIVTSMVVTYLFTKEKVTEETIKNNSSLIVQGKNNLITYLNGVVQTSLAIYSNERLYTMLDTKDIDYLSDKEISTALRVMSHSVKEIHQIYLYAEASNRSYRMINGVPNPSLGNHVKHESFPPGKDVFFETTHLSSDYGIPLTTNLSLSSATVISMHRQIINFPEKRTLGELSIDFKLDMIHSISENLYAKGEEELFILDHEGKVVYGPDPKQWGLPLEADWGRLAVANEAERGNFEWKKNGFSGINLFEKMKTEDLEWTIVKRIPYGQLYKNARQLTLINLMVLTIFLIIAIISTVYISFRFTAPIKKLIQYITKIGIGKLDVDIDLKRTDELGILAKRFHDMMQNLNHMILREYRLELANKSNQLRALQAQINPHFMNNALQSIGTLALQHDAPKIYALISSLAKMMRYSMNTSETLVTFQKEMEHVKAYLELQLQRFEDQLEYEFHIEKNTTLIVVPKMIIQPLVENYFKHGFEPGLGTGKLVISSHMLDIKGDPFLQISVEDNGKGITAERLLEITSAFHSSGEDDGDDGIGLSNVFSRLSLYYRNTAKLDIMHAAPQGVKILLTIPLIEEVEE